MTTAVAGTVAVSGDGVLHLAGRVGYANADRILPRGRAALQDAKVTRIDLSGIQQPDSATLAILLVWAAEAGRSRRVLTMTGMPPELRALAQLCGTENLLRLQ